LAMLALQLETAGPDHFVKVRGLIKDLISKLKDDAKAEATQKGFCDKNMKAAVDKRDKHQAKMESAAASIDTTTSNIATLKQEISDLAVDIADLNKAKLDMETLRKADKAANAKTVKDAGTGKTAVKQAIGLLKKFYEGQFVQVSYKPKGGNRDGQTVDDLAPDSFSNDKYKGNQEASKGIIGMMEVIFSDFDRTITQTEKEEKEAEQDYQTLLGETETDITNKGKLKKTKEGNVETANSDLTGFQDDLKDAKTMNSEALDELEKLSASCVEGTETYAERVKHRNDEIAALKDAMEMLDSWQD